MGYKVKGFTMYHRVQGQGLYARTAPNRSGRGSGVKPLTLCPVPTMYRVPCTEMEIVAASLVDPDREVSERVLC